MPPSSNQPLRIAILISGRGSNMQALVNTAKAENLNVNICTIISNKADAQGIQWAKDQGLPTKIIENRNYDSRQQFDAALLEYLQELDPDYILLAGFMRVLGKEFVQYFNGRIINIHPSLLPAFPGLNTHEKAIAAGVSIHGCSLHFVTPVLDDGPIIAQGVIPIHTNDTADDLAKRILPMEHSMYTQVLRWLVNGDIQLQANGKVLVNDTEHRAWLGDKLIGNK